MQFLSEVPLTVFWGDRTIRFASLVPSAGAVVRAAATVDSHPAKLLQNFGNHKLLTIVSDAPTETAARFVAQFYSAPAAGGLVVDPAGRALMIYRNGRWDLPKGHVEPGESPEQAALREVGEECGIDPVRLSLGPFLTLTHHIYELHGRWEIKPCRWWLMHYDGPVATVPQREEGIERAEWLVGEELRQAAHSAWNTVRTVLTAWPDFLSVTTEEEPNHTNR